MFQDAMRVGGASIEMRVRRFASFVRTTDEELGKSVGALLSGASRSLRRDGGPQALPVDADTKLPLVRVEEVDRPREEPVLNPMVRQVIERVIQERRAVDKLLAADLMPVRSVLMSGPPGVGKTMTASWLAQQLALPLLTLDLASVMSSYLGKTGANVRAVLNYAQEHPCVLLLDEFDSIAKRRNDDSDVGELKRLVTVILQTIDDWSSSSLLVAATNHGELLDPAVWRRFDATVTLNLPDHEQRSALLLAHQVPPELAQAIATVTDGQTFSAISRALDSARKQTVLDERPFDEALVAWAVSLPSATEKTASHAKRDHRDLLAFIYHSRQMTTREIADTLHTSHTTVVRSLKRFKGDDDGRA
ncbi:AAA family ATPase [Burkholderia sp. Ac-20379]|uniref:AAA family ATPase n=1 Tax=Burkholderia sp. Ac-20379 TaxID=2703900 RepID=UPI001F11CB5C|nr:AAA family ATPase [Burkholderia sp. Ac-20379]